MMRDLVPKFVASSPIKKDKRYMNVKWAIVIYPPRKYHTCDFIFWFFYNVYKSSRTHFWRLWKYTYTHIAWVRIFRQQTYDSSYWFLMEPQLQYGISFHFCLLYLEITHTHTHTRTFGQYTEWTPSFCTSWILLRSLSKKSMSQNSIWGYCCCKSRKCVCLLAL